MAWLFYILAVIFFISTIGLFTTKSKYLILFTIVLLTPSQLTVGLDIYAPAVFNYLYNIFLEENFSFRVLRPLVFTIPLGFLSIYILNSVRKKFF